MTPIPEHQRRLDPQAPAGRLVEGDRTPVPLTARVNRLLDERLCLSAGEAPVAEADGFMLYYDSPLDLVSVAGPCGPAGRHVGRRDVDRVIPEVLHTLYTEEVERVFLKSEAPRWPEEGRAAIGVRNLYDAERAADVILIPRPGVVATFDPARGTTHGSLNDPDAHVPLLLLGRGVPARRFDEACAPYDLAPSLADFLGVTMPEASGTSLLPALAGSAGRTTTIPR